MTGTLAPRRGLTGRALWTFAGQGFSSASNFLLTLVVLATATAGEFGTFALCLTTYLLCVQLCRYTLGTPMLVLYSEADGSDGTEWRHPLGLSLSLGVVVAIGLFVGAVLVGNHLPGGRGQLAVLGACMPLLLLQDTLRYLAFAQGRPSIAAISDGSWIGLQIVGFALVLWAGSASAAVLLGVWGAAAAVAGVGSAVALRAVPLLARGRGWLQAHRVLWRRLALEFCLTSGSYYALNYGLALLAGSTELGRLRAAQTLFGPVSVLLLGGTTLGVPESVRARHDPGRLRRFCVRLSVGLAAVALLSGGVVFALLPALGSRFSQDSWVSARSIIPLLAVFGAAVGASTGAIAGLRAVGESAWIVRARGVSGAAALVIGLPACWIVGANGALAALAVSEWIFARKAWARLGPSLRP